MSEILQNGNKERCERIPDAQAMLRVRAHNDDVAAQTGVRPAAFVLTFGCQQNEADSEHIAGMCREMGYRLADEPGEASLCHHERGGRSGCLRDPASLGFRLGG